MVGEVNKMEDQNLKKWTNHMGGSGEKKKSRTNSRQCIHMREAVEQRHQLSIT